MRYLGQVADLIKDDKEHYHLKYMVEREVVLRCLKHLICKHIRECQSDELIGSVICHLFNCLFAPKDFIKRLDEKEIQYEGSTIKEAAELNLIENI